MEFDCECRRRGIRILQSNDSPLPLGEGQGEGVLVAWASRLRAMVLFTPNFGKQWEGEAPAEPVFIDGSSPNNGSPGGSPSRSSLLLDEG